MGANVFFCKVLDTHLFESFTEQLALKGEAITGISSPIQFN